jgi:hypothetical protein
VLIISSILSACGSSDSPSIEIEDEEVAVPIEENTPAALMVNEIVASATDDGSDWIELYANADIADLSIYQVVDDNSAHVPQALPAVALSAGEFIVIQAIDESDTPPGTGYYVTFKLGGDDAVYLYENDTLISELDWQDLDAEEGYSYGLYLDGTGSAQTMLPTQGAANQEFTDVIVVVDTIINNNAELRINEVVAKDASDGDDWIEVYATGDDAVFLGDYSVSDENGELFLLPNVTIAAGEFYRVYATTDELEGSDTVAFKLGSSDEVSLFLDTDLIDQISWNKGDALIGFSYGRYPNGSDAIATLTPTPLSTNTQASKGPLVINEVLASQTDDSNDWFELYNNSNSSILLSDYQVIDSSDDIDPVTLPEISLASGEYLVIFATDDDPRSTYVPFKLGKEDELSLLKDD